jgi:hypothetical protein
VFAKAPQRPIGRPFSHAGALLLFAVAAAAVVAAAVAAVAAFAAAAAAALEPFCIVRVFALSPSLPLSLALPRVQNLTGVFPT